MSKKLISFLKNETVLIISALAAAVSAVFVPPSYKYLEYIDFRVLAILFSLMAVVSGLESIGIFNFLADALTAKAKTKRGIAAVLVFLCFFSSMFITNDVALITFVPFAIALLPLTDMKEDMIYIIVLQTVAANLGSMATPIGNPQNLYLYTYYNISNADFFKTLIPIAALSALILIILLLFVKNTPIKTDIIKTDITARTKLLVFYLILFAVAASCVLKLLDWRIMVIAVTVLLLIFDIKRYKAVDYSLLATFIMFFIFVGNIKNIPAVSEVISHIISGKELILSILFSQVISNVPAAVLISGFTENFKHILLGVNIGGLGTIIASLASLISFRFYNRTDNKNTLKYLTVFSAVNLTVIFPLILFAFIS